MLAVRWGEVERDSGYILEINLHGLVMDWMRDQEETAFLVSRLEACVTEWMVVPFIEIWKRCQEGLDLGVWGSSERFAAKKDIWESLVFS